MRPGSKHYIGRDPTEREMHNLGLTGSPLETIVYPDGDEFVVETFGATHGGGVRQICTDRLSRDQWTALEPLFTQSPSGGAE